MAFRQDFILRQIEKLSEAFFQIVSGKKAGKEDIVLIEETLSDVLKKRRQLLWSVGDETWELLDPNIAAEVARLWALHAVKSGRLEAARNAIDVSRYALGIELRGGAETLAEHMVDRLRTFAEIGLPDAEIAAYLELTFPHFVEHANWEKAEDSLFDRLAMGDAPELRAEGIAVFERLSGWSDEALEDHGLTREDIDQILTEL